MSEIINKINKLNEELRKLLEEQDQETVNILLDLENRGFKNYLLRYSRIYDRIFNGVDEDGYPDYFYEYNNTDIEFISPKYLKNIKIEPELEDDRILLGIDEDQDSGDYPSGGSDSDHISYSEYDIEYRNRYYLINGYKGDITIKSYILDNYANSKIAQLINQTSFDKEVDEIIEDLDNEEF